MREAKALTRLCVSADSSELLLPTAVISTKNLSVCQIVDCKDLSPSEHHFGRIQLLLGPELQCLLKVLKDLS